jgi:hypothetical protein
MKKLIAGVLAGLVLATAGVALAQNTREWAGNMIMRLASPYIRYAGTLKLQTLGGTNVLQASQTGIAVGASGSNIPQIIGITTGLTPAALGTNLCGTGNPGFYPCSTTELFSGIANLALGDVVFINPRELSASWPGPSRCSPLSADVSAAQVLRIRWSVTTSAACTPAPGLYSIYALRT